jgi:methylenetetrahydrofolate--tRNA-(uracil-5-)-methyltransferase
MQELIVIGGGLAGSEAAWQAAERGIQVMLYEMRPVRQTGAHTGANLAELVCSNSLGSGLIDRASGLLKEELRRFGSMLLECAHAAALPAGAALAVDREAFSQAVTARIAAHPNIRVVRQEAETIPDVPTIVASGPLTSPSLAGSLQKLTGQENLFFFDAIAPVVQSDSIDMSIAFRASRYAFEKPDIGDYINCPFDEFEYTAFLQALRSAERIPLRDFELQISTGVTGGAHRYFEGCLPIEVLAARDDQALAYGPMRPVGLRSPHTNRRPHAVVQLRQDNLAGTLYNLVGCQTNLTYPEQKRILSMIPGLGHAEFIRYGQMHRNTFVASPLVLKASLQTHSRKDLFLAGQITGVEGYMGNIATGLLAGINAVRVLTAQPPLVLPVTTMLGALLHYATHAELKDFQPMKAIFGILPDLDNPAKTKHGRSMQYVQRGLSDLTAWAAENDVILHETTIPQEESE